MANPAKKPQRNPQIPRISLSILESFVQSAVTTPSYFRGRASSGRIYTMAPNRHLPSKFNPLMTEEVPKCQSR
jgi:hypothetical protein